MLRSVPSSAAESGLTTGTMPASSSVSSTPGDTETTSPTKP